HPRLHPHTCPTRRSSDLTFDAIFSNVKSSKRQRTQNTENGTVPPRLTRLFRTDHENILQEDCPMYLIAFPLLLVPFALYNMIALDRKSTRLNSSHSQISY